MRLDILGNELSDGCLGCSIAKKEYAPPGGMLYETEHICIHQDPEVPIKGFLIISTKRHTRSISDFSQAELTDFMIAIHKARKALMRLKDIEHCTIIQEERSSHFHTWLLPRYSWMNERFDSSLSSIRPMMQYARENLKTKENLSEILSAVQLLKAEFV